MTRPPFPSRTAAHRPALAAFAVFGCAWVFVLVTFGALTTSIGAGMAFPDWPLSNGSVNPAGWLENLSLFAEHSHRLSGATMGLITLGLAGWLWHTEQRAWLRQLGWWALAAVVLQGLIGGTRVLLDAVAVPGFDMSLGQMLRIPHGVLAQVYVCLVIAIAAACTQHWRERPVPVGPAVRRLALVCCALLLVQLALAATMRHNAAGLAIPTFPFSTADGHLLPARWDFRVALHFAHRGMAVVVAGALALLAWVVWRDPRSPSALRSAAGALVALVGIQILLGAQIVWSLRHAHVTTAHVVTGALLFAATFWVAWMAHRDALERPADS